MQSMENALSLSTPLVQTIALRHVAENGYVVGAMRDGGGGCSASGVNWKTKLSVEESQVAGHPIVV